MSGYNVVTVEAVKSGIVCPHCKLVLRDAVQTLEEGYRLCEACYKEICRMPNRHCSDCGLALSETEQVYPDRAVRRDIMSLAVRCGHFASGCPWQGMLEHLEEHMEECCYTKPVQEGCSPTSVEQELHLGPEYAWKDLACGSSQPGHAMGDRRLYPCSQLVPSHGAQVPDDDGTYPHNLYEHKFSADQCEHHLDELVREQGAQIHQLKTSLESLKQQHEMMSGSQGFNSAVDSRVKELQSAVWGLREHIHQLETNMECLCELYVQQSEQLKTMSAVQGVKLAKDIQSRMRQLEGNIKQVEQQLQGIPNSTCFILHISEVSEKRRDAVEGKNTFIDSTPVYTGRNGYKMCIRVYLNGDDRGLGTHLSVFFVLMRGEYDPLLKWPFESKVSLILVDQSHREHLVQTFKPSFQKPCVDGFPQFAELSVLDRGSYVKDDVMYIKCIVDTSQIFHP